MPTFHNRFCAEPPIQFFKKDAFKYTLIAKGTLFRGNSPARSHIFTVGLLLLWLAAGAASAWASGIAIGAPGASSQITGRTPFSATATSNGLPITSMKAYLD